MAEQKFYLVGHAVAITVLAGNELQPGGNIFLLAFSDEFPSDSSQPGAEWIMRKFIETFRVFVFTWQMASRAACQPLCEELVIMLVERRLIRRRRAGLPERAHHRANDCCES